MGTVARVPTRRYHGWLVAALSPPRQRYLILSSVALELQIGDRCYPLWQARWASGALSPKPAGLMTFSLYRGIPSYRWDLGGWSLTETIYMVRGREGVVVHYQWEGPSDARLTLTPLFGGRDHHHLGAREPFQAAMSGEGAELSWGAHAWAIRVAGSVITSHPVFYRDIYYLEEANRGYPATEDLWSPGRFLAPLAKGHDGCWLVVEPARNHTLSADPARWARDEVTRRAFLAERGGPGALAAEAFVAETDGGTAAVIAGYPWFTDWGRDTMIALPGLTEALGDRTLPDRVLGRFAQSMDFIPNRWRDDPSEPEMNSVDASLWFMVIAGQLALINPDLDARFYLAAIDRMIQTYLEGTIPGIRVDPRDHLVDAKRPGEALTWMDARIGDRVITPRMGKPVEIQALWYNALRIRDRLATRLGAPIRYRSLASAVFASVNRRFPLTGRQGFYDVRDPDDDARRPNQVYALGLPYPVARRQFWPSILQSVTKDLYRPFGLLSLAPEEPGYRAHYGHEVQERDEAYHQGMAWPFLLGPFLDAWQKYSPAQAEAFRRQIRHWVKAHQREAGLGSISEIVEPDTGLPQGCPFQAWSVAEVWRQLSARAHPLGSPNRESF